MSRPKSPPNPSKDILFKLLRKKLKNVKRVYLVSRQSQFRRLAGWFYRVNGETVWLGFDFDSSISVVNRMPDRPRPNPKPRERRIPKIKEKKCLICDELFTPVKKSLIACPTCNGITNTRLLLMQTAMADGNKI